MIKIWVMLLFYVCTVIFLRIYYFFLGPTLLLTSDIIRERLGASALDR